MLIDRMITDAIDNLLKDTRVQASINNWFVENEPDLVEYAHARAREQISSMDIGQLPPQLYGKFNARLISNFMVGYMLAATGNGYLYTESLDVSTFRCAFSNDTGAIYQAFMAGKLDSKYYDPEYMSDIIDPDSPTSDWKKAVAAHKQLKEEDREKDTRLNIARKIVSESDQAASKTEDEPEKRVEI